MDAGSYTITNEQTGRVYIGGSLHVNARLLEHERQLGYERHNNRVLQADWLAQKGEGFAFEVVERFSDPADAYHAEKVLLDRFAALGAPLYNLRFDGHHSLGLPKVPYEGPKTISVNISLDIGMHELIREIVDAQREKEITWGRRGLTEWIRQACREKLERDVSPGLTAPNP